MCLCTPVIAFEWPKFPEPPQSTVKWMLRDSQINGVPVKVKIFSSKAKPVKVLAYYKRKWGGRSLENQFGRWQQVSHIDKRYMYLVQVQKDGDGSWGRLSVSDLKSAGKNKPGNGVPMMHNSRIVTDMFDEDDGWNARTTSLVNDFSLGSNKSFYDKHYSGKGWQSFMDQSRKTTNALVFRSGSESVNIAMYRRNGQTYVLLNHVNRTMLRP